ncbi:hypothetical protein V8C42DRAFT_328727 [Trichoderma barbatum]
MQLASCTKHRHHVCARTGRRVSRCEMMCWAGRQTQTHSTARELSSKPASLFPPPFPFDGHYPIIQWACKWRACQASFGESFCSHARTRGEKTPRQREPCSRAGNFL